MSSPPLENRRAGILDVAARAGVSRQTVTRAMNDMPGINAATKHRVLEAARELHYRPNRLGRGLVKQQMAPALGLVVVDLMNGFWAELASCVLDEAAERGWTVLIAEASHDVRAAVEQLLDHVDAVFGLIELPEDDLIDTFGSIPLLLLDDGSPSNDRPGIRLDFSEAMDAAVTHLAERGRRRIAMLDWSRTREISARAARFSEAAERAGLEPLVLHGEATREPVVETGRIAARTALQRWPDLDAFVCFNDAVAVGAMKHAQADGLEIPRDISVIGVDGSAIGLIVTPELTTLRFDLRDLARTATSAVVDMVQGTLPAHGPGPQWALRPELTVRGSS